MSAHDKALDKAKKHTHKRGEDDKCTICNMVMTKDGEADEKGKKPNMEYKFNKDRGAKNNDTEND